MILSKEKEQEYIKKVREDAMFLEEIENQTEAICLEAVRQNGYALGHVENRTNKICLEAIKENPLSIIHCSPLTDELLFEFFRNVDKFDIFPFDPNFYFVGEVEGEMKVFFEQLNGEEKLKSYRHIRFEVMSKQLDLKQSPYHVLERLYSH